MATVKVAISQDFMMAFAQVPKAQQKKVMEFVTKFRHDPQSSGINFEKIKNSKNSSYRSVRIDQNYRGIILKPAQGNLFVLLWVAKHDVAYNWAEKHQCEIHPETGALQIFESQMQEVNTTQEQASKDVLEPAPIVEEKSDRIKESEESVAPSAPLFNLTDEQLHSIGVPGELLGLVKQLSSEDELEKIEKKLPVQSFEALYLLAAGTSWEDIQRDYVIKPEGKVDTTDILAALERPESQRQFHLITDDLDLREMLEAPLEHWRVFLHPTQSKLVNRKWNGPVRVLGGAGTGKTVVAMHRARWLAANLEGGNQKILFTTFTANLATDIEQNLRKICSSKELEKIEVKHIDRWVSDFLKKKKYPHKIVYENRDKEYDDIWRLAEQLIPGELALPVTFYKEEWQRVILPQRIITKASYFKATRAGRGVALTRKQRADIWPVFEELRTRLHQKGLRVFEDATLDASDILKNETVTFPYKHVIVDETQDMGPEALTLIRSLVPEDADDLFLVGDGHQRIYRRKTTMSHCGIKIIGRSRKLRINYRTTEETRKFAISVLENIPVDDLDGGIDSIQDYKSLMHGDKPQITECTSSQDEISGLASKIKGLEDQGNEMQDMCIAVRTRKIRDSIASGLEKSGVAVLKLDQQKDNRSTPGVRIATMHRVKGLEFRFMFLASLNEGIVPLHYAASGTEDPVEARQSDLNERALFHVACTRASKKLFLSYYGAPSEYLSVK
ncbi:MAG: 3'-5' exonuclease [Gammaproteobacteria bacterium]|nr:3'-5' exonuclease [Gammaproteobacteria bacterium]